MSLGHYEVRETIVAARPVAGVRAQVPRGRVAQEFGRHLDQVYAAARAGAVVLDGQNIFIYRAATDEQLTVDFCVGVTARFAAVGVVLPLETPRGVAAMTTHHGDYGGLGRANAAILAWCRAHDRALAGPSWEVYGHWHADPAQLRTDVYYLLQATVAPLSHRARIAILSVACLILSGCEMSHRDYVALLTTADSAMSARQARLQLN